MSLSTVHRAMQLLVAAGQAQAVHMPGSSVHYAHADVACDVCFTCAQCQRVLSFAHSTAETPHWTAPGFTVEDWRFFSPAAAVIVRVEVRRTSDGGSPSG
jgi:Fe2+ or Zn2+ uptake regulation protein